MMEYLYVILLLICWTLKGEAACTFPSDMIDSWETSSMGTLTFISDSQVSIPDVLGTTRTFNCHVKTGSQYVLRSVDVVNTVFGTDLYGATCFEFTAVTTSVKYKYFHATQKSGTSPFQRFKYPPSTTDSTAANTCDETAASVGTHDFMIKNDSISSAVTRCPDAILGIYTSTVDGQCSSNTTLNVCSNKEKLSFDTTYCTNNVAYSSGGDLSCVYSVVDNGNTFLTLYNNDITTDESNTYKFTCMMMAINGTNNIVQATQSPQHCLAAQTIDTSAGTVVAMDFETNVTCVYDTTTAGPTTTSASPQNESQIGSASVAAGASIAVLAIIVLVVLLLFFLVFRKGAPYPAKNCGKCSESPACSRFLDCLSCQCCCPKRGGKVQPDAESVLTTEEIGVTANDDSTQQVTGNGREVEVIPAPAPPPTKSLEEITADIKPKTLAPIEQERSHNNVEDADIKLPTKLPPIDSPRSVQTKEVKSAPETKKIEEVSEEHSTEKVASTAPAEVSNENEKTENYNKTEENEEVKTDGATTHSAPAEENS
ncbi:hypothetical protein LOTGIDRAFT_228664 [Lottia gigantea]|uniref:DUF7042 domain-containing protein n=1 Tax=Lottia gigantea TaxID=225164 RepID=V4AB19_LOTGI|nr:hypothetical protein LOTGIDRAFT_228664 [Lottia gigantea]ESO93982.1 hypothetical protein LOTGIDRAFT_228664 [Lottia gigantea]